MRNEELMVRGWEWLGVGYEGRVVSGQVGNEKLVMSGWELVRCKKGRQCGEWLGKVRNDEFVVSG